MRAVTPEARSEAGVYCEVRAAQTGLKAREAKQGGGREDWCQPVQYPYMAGIYGEM